MFKHSLMIVMMLLIPVSAMAQEKVYDLKFKYIPPIDNKPIIKIEIPKLKVFNVPVTVGLKSLNKVVFKIRF